MLVGSISLINLTYSDVYIYLNHNNPHKALHILPMEITGLTQSNKPNSPLEQELIKPHAIHLLRSADHFSHINLFNRSNQLIIEFDGIYYRYVIPICPVSYAIELPMVMALHPQFISLETVTGRLVWQVRHSDLMKPIKLFDSVNWGHPKDNI